MKGIILITIFIITLSIAADAVPVKKSKPKNPLNRDEICKKTKLELCVDMVRLLGAENFDESELNKFGDRYVLHIHTIFGDTSIKAMEIMKENNTLDVKVKEALSNCAKVFLETENELRQLRLSVDWKKYVAENPNYIQKPLASPKQCEDGLNKAGTTGEKLYLYPDTQHLEELLTTVDVVVHYVNDHSN